MVSRLPDSKTFPEFTGYSLQAGLLQDLSDTRLPMRVGAWRRSRFETDESATTYGYVHSGKCRIDCASGRFDVHPGMYFSVPGRARVGGRGSGILIERFDYDGVFLIGGPVEREGRSPTFDGCSSSILLPPVERGDPCLSYSYVPPDVEIPPQTHLTFRVGVITRGRAVCRTAECAIAMSAGMVFVIRPDAVHSFQTTVEELGIVAFHPDSDPGGEDAPTARLSRSYLEARGSTRV